jgi:hypothetical protein
MDGFFAAGAPEEGANALLRMTKINMSGRVDLRHLPQK